MRITVQESGSEWLTTVIAWIYCGGAQKYKKSSLVVDGTRGQIPLQRVRGSNSWLTLVAVWSSCSQSFQVREVKVMYLAR